MVVISESIIGLIIFKIFREYAVEKKFKGVILMRSWQKLIIVIWEDVLSTVFNAFLFKVF